MNIFRSGRQDKVATIANGATTSDVIDVKGYAIHGLIMPAAFTGASVSFTVSDVHDGTFVALYDSAGVLVSVPVVASRAYDLPAELAVWPFVKIVSASAEAAARSLKVLSKS